MVSWSAPTGHEANGASAFPTSVVALTPFVSVFLAAIPFGPGFARRAVNLEWLGGLFALSPWAPVMLMFALLVIFYRERPDGDHSHLHLSIP